MKQRWAPGQKSTYTMSRKSNAFDGRNHLKKKSDDVDDAQNSILWFYVTDVTIRDEYCDCHKN